jgi:hypothetical protein
LIGVIKNSLPPLSTLPVELYEAWNMVRKVPHKDVWKTLEDLDLGYLHKLAVHPIACKMADVLFDCPALRKGLNRTNIDVVFNHGGVIEARNQ